MLKHFTIILGLSLLFNPITEASACPKDQVWFSSNISTKLSEQGKIGASIKHDNLDPGSTFKIGKQGSECTLGKVTKMESSSNGVVKEGQFIEVSCDLVGGTKIKGKATYSVDKQGKEYHFPFSIHFIADEISHYLMIACVPS